MRIPPYFKMLNNIDRYVLDSWMEQMKELYPDNFETLECWDLPIPTWFETHKPCEEYEKLGERDNE